MKKLSIIASAVLLTGTMYAEQFYLTQGWQLIGTGINSVETFNKSCVDTVWTYDKVVKSWKAYSPSTSTMSTIESSAFVNTLENINKNDGFWVNANNDCMISSSVEPDDDITPFEITTNSTNFNSGSLINKYQAILWSFTHPLDINKAFGCDLASVSCDDEEEISEEILNNIGMSEGYSSEYKTLDSYSDISNVYATLSFDNKTIKISWTSSQTISNDVTIKYFTNETLNHQDDNKIYSALDQEAGNVLMAMPMQ